MLAKLGPEMFGDMARRRLIAQVFGRRDWGHWLDSGHKFKIWKRPLKQIDQPDVTFDQHFARLLSDQAHVPCEHYLIAHPLFHVDEKAVIR